LTAARALFLLFAFFFQAEDGIRDRNVTGVQTCALPIFNVGNKATSNCAASKIGRFDIPATFATPGKSLITNTCSLILLMLLFLISPYFPFNKFLSLF